MGRTVRVDHKDLRIVGVLRDWRLTPKFYDLNNGGYAKLEQIFIPFSTAIEQKFATSGSRSCWGREVA
ncbi:ABC transporter permease [Xanthomonas hortorum pv. pelargonii]|nr:ABC transporter permease [Xanthomonas hortorum pv. pelargonii]